MGYTVVDAGTVVATHLNHLITTHAAELLGREEVQQLLDHLAKEAPKLVEDLVPKLLPLSHAAEGAAEPAGSKACHIRDMRTIVEALAEHAPRITRTPTELTALVRIALGRAIVQQLFPGDAELQVMALDNRSSACCMQAMDQRRRRRHRAGPGRHPAARRPQAASQRQEQMGLTPVLLVPAPLRALLSRFLRRACRN